MYHEYAHNSLPNCSDRLGTEEYINKSEFVDLNSHLLSPGAKMISNYFNSLDDLSEENRGLDKYNKEFMESSKFVVSADIPMDVKKLEGAIDRIYELIVEDQDYRLYSNIVKRLVQVLEYSDIQYQAVSILSSARFLGCNKLLHEQVIPVLVKLISHPSAQFAQRVVITLTCLALASSDHIPVIVDNGALEAAQKFVSNSESGVFYVVHYLAMLLLVVCGAKNLTPDKEEVAISILQCIFENKFHSSTTIHIKRACNAFSYISYGRHLAATDEGCDNLVKFISDDDDELVAAAALGIVGNIVRWGSVGHIQYLVERCQLLECLGKSVLCSTRSEHKK